MHDTTNILTPLVLSLREGARLTERPDGGILLQCANAQLPIGEPSSGLLAALRALASNGATAEQLIDLVVQYDGVSGLPTLLACLQRLTQGGVICHTVIWPQGRLATLSPTSPVLQRRFNEPTASVHYVLSRFSYLHRVNERLVLESPLTPSILVLHDWRATVLLQTLAKLTSLEELCNTFQDLPQTSVALFVHLLVGCRMLSSMRDNGQLEEETPTLTQWDFHDLLFHARSRIGKHNAPYGATFRFLGKVDSLPAVKPPMSDEVIRLYKPDIQTLKDNDISFTRVLEERRSIRTYSERPITVEQLGEFLYRTARIRALPGTAQEVYERSDRPYPSAGACYELELYIVVNSCMELASGLYHYCPKEHQLYRLTGRTREVEMLLEGAYYAAGQQGVPQILLILAARFQRVAWKYEAMAYAAVLKHVGVFYQTMYLVATAMGLAACALGSGNSNLFTTVAGMDYYAETSVGEFMLGCKEEE